MAPRALILLLAGFVALRFAFLDRHDLWIDESISVYNSTRPQILRAATEDLAELPLYPVALALWMRGGDSVGWLRGFSALLGSAALVAFALFVRRRFGPAVGFAALVFAGLSSFLVYYSQEVRTYALILLLSTLTLSALLELAWSERPKVAAWLLYGTGMLLLIYDHYFCFLYLGACFVAGFGFDGIRHRWVIWLLAHLAIGGCFLPWLPYALSAMNKSGGIDVVWKFRDWVLDLSAPFVFFSVGKSLYPVPGTSLFVPEGAALVGGVLAAGVLAVSGATSLWRRGRRDLLCLVAAVMLLPLVALAIATRLGVPIYNYTRVKYLIFACPAWMLLVSIGAGALWEGGRRRLALATGAILVAANLLSMGNYFFNPEYLRAPAYREAAALLGSKRGPGEPIVCSNIWTFWPIWANLRAAPGPDPIFPIGDPVPLCPSRNIRNPAELGLPAEGTFWLIEYRDWRRRAAAVDRIVPPGWEAEVCPVVETHSFRGLVIERRRRSP